MNQSYKKAAIFKTSFSHIMCTVNCIEGVTGNALRMARKTHISLTRYRIEYFRHFTPLQMLFENVTS